MNTDSFVIKGLGGARTLNGSVTISGAKNSALKAMAAAVLFDGPVTLENVPSNRDIQTMADILQKLGAKITFKTQRSTENNGSKSSAQGSAQTVIIDASGIHSTTIDPDLAGGMRASVVLTGPMLGRYKKVTFPAPGGCVIGARPIDLFLSGYEQMGAQVNEHDCVYDISTVNGLNATEITFKKISVGATETLMMAAVLSDGTTVLKNCAREPEIVNVAEWLNVSGASIVGAGTSTITIQGTKGKLLTAQQAFVTIPDRITAGSFLILGALAANELTIKNCRPDHMEAVTNLLIESGVRMKIGADFIVVYGNGAQADSKNPANSSNYTSIPLLQTKEYPGFPTDLQSPMVTFLTQCSGESKMVETIFEGRFKYVEDLIKLGAKVQTLNPHEIVVTGQTPLKASDESLTAHDIRAGFAVVLAALLAKGTSTVKNVHLIDRGYEQLEVVLKGLGADIQRSR